MRFTSEYRAMLGSVRPGSRLDREVLASVRRCREAEGEAVVLGQGSGLSHMMVETSRRGRPSLTRRAFVATACGLGAVALVAGVPAVLKSRRGGNAVGLWGDGPTDPVELARVAPVPESAEQAEPARCGLAMLGQDPGPTPVPATSAGIVPVSYTVAHGNIWLRLNLNVWGEGVESVRYTLEGLLSVNDMGAAMGGGALLVAAFSSPVGPNGDASREYYGFKGQGLSLEGTVADDGAFECPEGESCLLYCLMPYEAVRALDPVLDAYWSWNSPYQQTALPPEPTEEDELRVVEANQEASEQADRLNAMLDELYADPARFYEWMRTCYVTTVDYLSRQLQEATLVLEASFADGTSERHGYRIGLVGDFAEAAAGRFDALVESSPYDIAAAETLLRETVDGRGDWCFDNLPFGFFLDGQPFDEDAAADPRLSRPLFTVEEVPV